MNDSMMKTERFSAALVRSAAVVAAVDPRVPAHCGASTSVSVQYIRIHTVHPYPYCTSVSIQYIRIHTIRPYPPYSIAVSSVGFWFVSMWALLKQAASWHKPLSAFQGYLCSKSIPLISNTHFLIIEFWIYIYFDDNDNNHDNNSDHMNLSGIKVILRHNIVLVFA